MKKFSLLFVVLFVGTIISVQGITSTHNELISEPVFADMVEITNNTLWEGLNKSFNNESVIVGVDGNLTIVNSHVNFTNFEDTGIIVDGGYLRIKNSVIEFGDDCISGTSNGTVLIEDSTITNCLDEGVSLEGDYIFELTNSQITNVGGHGVDLFGLDAATFIDLTFDNLIDNAIIAEDVGTVEMSNITVINAGDRGMRIRGSGDFTAKSINITGSAGDGLRSDVDGYVWLEDVTITKAGGDGLQIENSANATLKNIVIDSSVEDGFKGDSIKLLTVNNIEIKSAGSDGADLENMEEVSLIDISITNTVETGFEVDFINDLSLVNTVISGGDYIGADVVNVTNIEFEHSEVSDNADVGISLNTVSSFSMNGSEVSGNLNGIVAVNVTTAQVAYTKIIDNTNNAIDASEMGAGRTFQAGSNWWGTTDTSEIATIGSVNINPLLESKAGLYGEESATSTTSTNDTTSSTDEEVSFAWLIFSLGFVSIPFIRRRVF